MSEKTENVCIGPDAFGTDNTRFGPPPLAPGEMATFAIDQRYNPSTDLARLQRIEAAARNVVEFFEINQNSIGELTEVRELRAALGESK